MPGRSSSDIEGGPNSVPPPTAPVAAPPPLTGRQEAEDEVSLLDILIVLAKHKKLVLGLPLGAAVVAAIVSLFLTPIYTGTTKILPPQESQSTATALLGQLGAAAGVTGQTLGIKNPNDMYVGMLKSRTVADNIIERFNLKQRYDKKYLVDTRKRLADRSDIRSGKDGIITIEVDDEDPKNAADLANAYVDELIKLTTTLAVTEAGRRRLFLERQLQQAKDNLVKAEYAARKALETGGVAVVDEQGKSMIESIAGLRAGITAKKVQIGAMSSFATSENPEMVKARQELAALQQQLAKLEGVEVRDVLRADSKADGAGLKNLALLRDVKYNETLFELLAKQFEIAKIDEAKEGAVVQVLDEAVAPERRSRPKRVLIVVLTAFGAGFLAVITAFVLEAMERAHTDPSRARRVDSLRQYLRWR